MNDYSAPTAYGFRDVLVKGFVDEVAIICGASEIARHPRVYGHGQFVFDPKHYLALVAAAALDAIRLGAISFDAVKQLVIAKVEHRPANLELGHYPYLPAANVKTTSAADYMVLVSGRAA
jgi:hypothetical protein